MARLNILQLVNGFAIGGGELKLLELVAKLNKDKYNVIVCSVGQGGPLQDDFEKVSSKVYVFSKVHRFDFSLILKVVKLMKREQINIVQTTLFYADVIGAAAAWLAKVPVVISWDVVTHPFNKLHSTAYHLAQRNMNRVITVSDAINRQVVKERKVDPTKVKTIHYGVDHTKYKSYSDTSVMKRKEFGFKKDDVILGTVARLTEQKGHKYLIEAAYAITRKFPKVKFAFIGDGPLRQNLQQQISHLGLDSHFSFLGFRNDIPEIVGMLDVFVLPSLYEGLPNVVLEVMACGKPVVATAVDGTPEAVTDGTTGILVPPRDPQALETAIIELLSDHNRRFIMGQEARKRMETIFSLDKQVEKFEKLYDSFDNSTLP